MKREEKLNLREERVGAGGCLVESGVQVGGGVQTTRQLWDRALTQQERKRELLADFEGKAESCGWTRNGESSW